MGRERETPKRQQVSYAVEQLVAVNPYNPDILPDLENYVSSQTYSLDANLCLLRKHTVSTRGLNAGFDQAIQAYAIHVLSPTYQRIPRPVLAEVINIEGLYLDKFLEHQATNSGWIF
ncbi:hypothetical protein CRYUN_Cryun03dG0022600 [Craigia yunnanensis]